MFHAIVDHVPNGSTVPHSDYWQFSLAPFFSSRGTLNRLFVAARWFDGLVKSVKGRERMRLGSRVEDDQFTAPYREKKAVINALLLLRSVFVLAAYHFERKRV